MGPSVWWTGPHAPHTGLWSISLLFLIWRWAEPQVFEIFWNNSSLVLSFTCPLSRGQHAGPFLGTHRSCKRGPRCPTPLSGGRRRAWTHQPRIRLLLLGPSQVHAAPHDFKGPRQCLLGKMRSGTGATQQSVIGRGHGAPSGPERVVLAGGGVTRLWPSEHRTREQEPHVRIQRGEGMMGSGAGRRGGRGSRLHADWWRRGRTRAQKTIMRTDSGRYAVWDGASVICCSRQCAECVCSTSGLFDKSHNRTEVRQVGGGWGGGQESPHRRQNILPQYSQKSHPPVSSQPDLNILSPVQTQQPLPHTPSRQRITWSGKTQLWKHWGCDVSYLLACVHTVHMKNRRRKRAFAWYIFLICRCCVCCRGFCVCVFFATALVWDFSATVGKRRGDFSSNACCFKISWQSKELGILIAILQVWGLFTQLVIKKMFPVVNHHRLELRRIWYFYGGVCVWGGGCTVCVCVLWVWGDDTSSAETEVFYGQVWLLTRLLSAALSTRRGPVPRHAVQPQALSAHLLSMETLSNSLHVQPPSEQL